MTFEFHPEARDEFHDAAHWYEERSLYAGDRFMAAVRVGIHEVISNPTRYQPVDGDVRVFRLKKYPFRLYYTYDEVRQLVCIYSVMHEKRRPDYWRKRLDG